MIALTLAAGGVMATIGIGYLVLGRNRYGEMGLRSRKRPATDCSANSSSLLNPQPGRKIRVYFIKPSRYNDQGYIEFFGWGVNPITR